MKKTLFIFCGLLINIVSYGQYYYRASQPVRTVYVNRPVSTIYDEEHKKEKGQIGIITRFGYSFADYFDYGASLYYKFNPRFGIMFGVDGASKVSFKDGIKDAYKQTVGNVSQWDVRGGFIFGKYFALGGIYGNCKVCTDANKDILSDTAFKWHHDNNIHDVGGFATFLLPINDYIGFDVDLAYTTHTFFNISAGITLSIPVKK